MLRLPGPVAVRGERVGPLAALPGFPRSSRTNESTSEANGNPLTWHHQLSPGDATRTRLYWAIVAALVSLAFVEAQTAWPGPGNLYDFGAFLGVGRAIRDGIPPYLVLPTTPYVLVNGSIVPWPNANPPALLPLLYVASALAPLPAFRGWFILCIVLYACLVGILLYRYPSWRSPCGIALLGAFLPFWSSEERGQIYVPLALLATGAWFALTSSRFRLAGVLLGVIVALKPNFAVWPGLLLLTGYRTTGVWAVAVALGLSAIPAVLYGPEIYTQWFEAIRIGETVDMRIVSSVFSIGAIIGRAEWTTAIGVVVSAGLIFGLVVWSFKVKRSVAALSAAAILTALMVGPITWHGYGVIVLPVLLSRRWSWTLTAAVALSFFPYNILPFFALV
jgi:hypothetical protein